MKSFEVQTHRASRWHTDSTYDDRGLAELRARQIESNERADPVRVVEEVFVEKTQKYVWRTIWYMLSSALPKRRHRDSRSRGDKPLG